LIRWPGEETGLAVVLGTECQDMIDGLPDRLFSNGGIASFRDCSKATFDDISTHSIFPSASVNGIHVVFHHGPWPGVASKRSSSSISVTILQ
jgi:hypothetical protein